jgi:aryl-alcohol dehydrogenase-like predicted oxidoreductase
MGTWITFNVGSSRRLRDGRAEVLRTFFDRGGTVVDSSPMYGSAEDVIGYCLDKIGKRESLFGTTKVWTPPIADGAD